MFNFSTRDQAKPLTDQAAGAADHAIKSTQDTVNEALDTLADSVEDLRSQATPLLGRVSEQTRAMAHRGADAVRASSHQLRDSAVRVSDGTVAYVRDEPVKSLFIAAAAGAALMALLTLASRSRPRG